MKRTYKLLNCVTDDKVYCFAEPRPRGAYAPVYRMTRGESIASKYPDDQYSVELHLDEDRQGLKLPSFVGNTGKLIILQKDVARYIQDNSTLGPVETFAFTLINHKGRVHSKDYVFFSPLGTQDCLDLDRSEMRRWTDGSIQNVSRIVLDLLKLVDAPDVVRIRESASDVLFSVELVETIEAQGFTNFKFNDVEVSHQ